MTHEDDIEHLLPKYPKNDKYEDVTFPVTKYAIPRNRPVRIYCDGVFDMFHYGHARLFAQVKNMFPDVWLIVGLHADEVIVKCKGDVVMNEQERYESVRHCRYVDEVVEDAPWVLDDINYLMEHRIDYVAHDDKPYPGPNHDDIYGYVKELKMFIPTKRSTNISTTKIITGIVKDYDKYIRRQVLRGTSYRELNISYLTMERIRFENIIKEDIKNVKKDITNAYTFWQKVSRIFHKKMFEDVPMGISRIFGYLRRDSKLKGKCESKSKELKSKGECELKSKGE